MNDNLDSTSGQGPKKLTEADIIREAIACAKKHGWEVGPGVCQIRPVVPNADPVAEIGLGWSTITPPTTEWDVHITPRVPPNPYSTPLRVHIEYNQGLVSDFYGPTLSGSEGGTSLDYRPQFESTEREGWSIKMLNNDERERLKLIEAFAYSCTGQVINLVNLCESWLESSNPALQAIVRYLTAGPDSTLFVIDQALLETQPELMQALLHTMRGFLKEEDEPVVAFAEYTATIKDVPPGEAREAILAARRRVAYIAN